jgi:condensin-2 complex subunit H2
LLSFSPCSLEEYLEKLAVVLHSGHNTTQGTEGFLLSQQSDGGAGGIGVCFGTTVGTSLDFTQAALLVQNSSAVYSRKVDYFSTLVTKALEGLQQQQQHQASSLNGGRGAGGGSASRGGTRSGATEADLAFWELIRGENYEFLTLDDVMPPAKPSDITRAQRRFGVGGVSDSSNHSDSRRTSALLSSSRHSASFYSHSTLSQLQRLSLQRPNGSSQHSSSTAQLLEHLEATGGADRLGEDGIRYRVPAYHTLNLVGSKCAFTLTGALLLPGVAGAASGAMPGSRLLARRRNLDASLSIPTVVQTSTPAGNSVRVNDDADDSFPIPSIDDFDDDNGGPGFDFGGSSGEENREEELHVEAESSFLDAIRVGAVAGVLKLSQNRRAPGNAAIVRKAVKFDDPWELLDPHQPLGTYRPLRKGKTLVVPAGLHDLPSDCVTGARTKRRTGGSAGPDSKLPKNQECSLTPPLSGSYATDMYRHLTQGTDLPELPLTRLAFGDEFAYVAKRHRQAYEAERRKARREGVQGLPVAPSEDKDNPFVTNDLFDHDNDDDAGFGAFDDADDRVDRDDYEYDNGGGTAWPDDDNNTGNAGLASVDDVFRRDGMHASRDFLSRSDSDMHLTWLFPCILVPSKDNDGLTFEELCRVHIQRFAKGAEKYANETKLLSRVRKWQEKIQPLLEEEEQRQAFDIHEYGLLIIKTLQELSAQRHDADGNDGDATVPFEYVARSCPKFDVPRIFLTTLSLCNSGNVSIDQDLNVQLLNPVVEHPMETYLAPSAREAS